MLCFWLCVCMHDSKCNRIAIIIMGPRVPMLLYKWTCLSFNYSYVINTVQVAKYNSNVM